MQGGHGNVNSVEEDTWTEGERQFRPISQACNSLRGLKKVTCGEYKAKFKDKSSLCAHLRDSRCLTTRPQEVTPESRTRIVG